MNTLALFQMAVRYGPIIKNILDEATSNDDVSTKVRTFAPALAQVLEQAGAEFFPKAAPALHLVGGLIASFDPNVTKWLQGVLNSQLQLSPPLIVDGDYGKKTKAAVEQIQAKLGLTVDGIAGQVTQAALQGLLAKL